MTRKAEATRAALVCVQISGCPPDEVELLEKIARSKTVQQAKGLLIKAVETRKPQDRNAKPLKDLKACGDLAEGEVWSAPGDLTELEMLVRHYCNAVRIKRATSSVRCPASA